MKKPYYIYAAFFLILIIANPSLKDFKDHIGITNSTFESQIFASRNHNFFICSTYKANLNGGYYFAIAGNFFYIRSKKEISDDNLQKIYNQLSQNREQLNKLDSNLELGSFDEFKEKLKDKGYRMTVYPYAGIIMKMQIENYSDFEKDVNLVSN